VKEVQIDMVMLLLALSPLWATAAVAVAPPGIEKSTSHALNLSAVLSLSLSFSLSLPVVALCRSSSL
jgi:hypothetical protein